MVRNFIRHPSNIPINFQLEEVAIEASENLKDFSVGGLSFSSKHALLVGSNISIKISLVQPVFQVIGRVSWCRPENNQFEVGVEFLDKNDMFRTRMVEQICHIEQYRREVLKKEGRNLNGEQAALEWIRKFAPQFPGSEDDAE